MTSRRRPNPMWKGRTVLRLTAAVIAVVVTGVVTGVPSAPASAATTSVAVPNCGYDGFNANVRTASGARTPADDLSAGAAACSEAVIGMVRHLHSSVPVRPWRFATYNGGGVDRTFTHFTDEAGAVGITGTKPLAVGDSVGVGQLSFGKGQNNFLANAPGDNFVTDLPSTASSGQLNGIGVFGTRQQYAISFSEADAFTSGYRVQGTAQASRGIYTIPGGCTITGSCTVTRVR